MSFQTTFAVACLLLCARACVANVCVTQAELVNAAAASACDTVAFVADGVANRWSAEASEDLLDILKSNVGGDVVGSACAFERSAPPKQTFCYETEAETECTGEGFDYTTSGWYTQAKELYTSRATSGDKALGALSDPYFDPTASAWLSTFSAPVVVGGAFLGACTMHFAADVSVEEACLANAALGESQNEAAAKLACSTASKVAKALMEESDQIDVEAMLKDAVAEGAFGASCGFEPDVSLATFFRGLHAPMCNAQSDECQNLADLYDYRISSEDDPRTVWYENTAVGFEEGTAAKYGSFSEAYLDEQVTDGWLFSYGAPVVVGDKLVGVCAVNFPTNAPPL